MRAARLATTTGSLPGSAGARTPRCRSHGRAPGTPRAGRGSGTCPWSPRCRLPRLLPAEQLAVEALEPLDRLRDRQRPLDQLPPALSEPPRLGRIIEEAPDG